MLEFARTVPLFAPYHNTATVHLDHCNRKQPTQLNATHTSLFCDIEVPRNSIMLNASNATQCNSNNPSEHAHVPRYILVSHFVLLDFLILWMIYSSHIMKSKFSHVVSSYRISYRLIQVLFLIRLVSQLSALSAPNSQSWKNFLTKKTVRLSSAQNSILEKHLTEQKYNFFSLLSFFRIKRIVRESKKFVWEAKNFGQNTCRKIAPLGKNQRFAKNLVAHLLTETEFQWP